MNKKLWFLALVSVFILAGAGCGEVSETPAGENKNQNVNQGAAANTNVSAPEPSEEIVAPSEEEASETGGVMFVDYANKSLGYKIVRPEKWYWQHFIQKEIGEAMPGVTDLFVTDPNPLPSLGSEYLGRIVIEVSDRSLAELERNFSDLTSSAATVGGVSATKYEGVRTNEMVENQKVITYLFQKDSKTYRVAYSMKNSTTEDEEIFQKLVSSFSF